MPALELAIDLIKIPSINPAGQDVRNNSFGEAALGGRIKTILRNLGATEIETTYPLPGRPNIIGYFDFNAPKTILFEAHLDTVPVAGMTIDPFAGECRDGRLWGRGASDVKGPMAAMLAAISDVKTTGTAKVNVLFAAVCDEEAGFAGVRHLLQNLRREWKEKVQFAIVAEPTELQPVAAHKGVVRWHVTTHGVAAHSSTPHLGRNAIYEMADALTLLRTHAEDLPRRPAHIKLGTPSISVGTIVGGSASNIVPDHCSVHVDRRLVPGESPEQALAELQTLLSSLPQIEISAPSVAAPAFEVSDTSASVTACLQAAREIGVHSQPQYANYCTDACFYPQHGIEAVVFGPGSITQAHTADEWIGIDALEAGARAYAKILS